MAASAPEPFDPAAVEAALDWRRSFRAFLPRPVAPALLERLLELAARAPSGTNMQPWGVHVVTGEARRRLSEALVEAHHAGPRTEAEYRYYPAEFPEPYLARRRKVGWDLYGLLGIQRGETERMKHQHGRNFRFFDAPVGLVTTIDRRLEIGSWLDHGMFLQSLLIAAAGHGIGSCPQAAFAQHHAIIRQHLGLPENEVVVCGVSLGYPDPDAPENTLRTEREAVRDFTTFHE